MKVPLLEEPSCSKAVLTLNTIGTMFYTFVCFVVVYRLLNCVYVWTHYLSFSTARLVLALGAEPKLDLVPGAMEFALPFYTLNDAIVRVGLFYFFHL